jgi:diacylglycerol kinase
MAMKHFVQSLACALRGIGQTIRNERSFQIQLVALGLTIAMGVYLGLSVIEWGLVTLAAGFVLAAEVFNTAIERLSDEVTGGKKSRLIRLAKDIAAGAVLLAALTALDIGIIILFIPFVRRLLELFQGG